MYVRSGVKNYTMTKTFQIKFMRHILHVKLTTNSAMVYTETGRFPLSIYVNLCIVKFWFKIVNSDVHKLINIVHHHLLHQPCIGE